MSDQPNLLTPPHSIEAEQAVIGAMLIIDVNSQGSREVLDLLHKGMLYNHSHQLMYNGLAVLAKRKISADLVSLTEYLEENNELEDAGGFSYVAECAKNCPSAANIHAYAKIIKERYLQRELISIANSVAEQSFALTQPDDTKRYIEQAITSIDDSAVYEAMHLAEVIPDWITNLEARNKGDVKATGRKTGIKTLDEQIIGLGATWLILIAGRPSMGKTLIAQVISSYISRTVPVLFFSMEMSDIEVTDRYVSIMAGIDPKALRKGELSDLEWHRASQIIKQINDKEINIFFDDTPALSVNQIAARAKATRKKHGQLGLIVIDYLELMTRPKAEREDIALAEICRRLKQLCGEIETPILLLGQANRETDRVNRPTMANIKGGTGIEANCDLILFAHREEVNNPETEFRGVTELIPAKSRHCTCVRTSYLRRLPDDQGGRIECLSYADSQLLINNEQASNNKPRKNKKYI